MTVRGQTGKGANRVLFFGAGNGNAQMAKNRNGCLFRTLFLWLLSFGGAKESDKKFKRGCPFETPSFKFKVKISK